MYKLDKILLKNKIMKEYKYAKIGTNVSLNEDNALVGTLTFHAKKTSQPSHVIRY